MNDYQAALKKYKELIINNEVKIGSGELERAGIPARVVEAWLKTKRLGVPADMPSLPKDSREKTILNRILGATKQNWNSAKGEYYDIGELLSALGAALYFLDDHLAIYNYIGNNELISRMKEHGFKFSYSLQEKYMGVYPANAAQKRAGIIKMEGQEHPLEIFKDMCSMACTVKHSEVAPYKSFDYSLIDADYVVLLIVPMSRYNEHVDIILRLVLEKLIPTCSNHSINRTYANMFVLSEETNKTPTLFLSPDCKIIYLNKQFETEFNCSLSQYSGVAIKEVVPELAFLEDTIRKQSKLKFMKTNINVRGVRYTYYVETRFLRNPGGSINSMRVSLSTQGNVDYYLKNLNSNGNVAVFTFDSLIGNSESFLRAKNIAEKTADSNSSVLVTGESGVGKELFAQAIHNGSSRRNGPFVAVNCGSIPKELLGSELFGYEQGAFTGARKDGQIGKIELAEGGTLFLDEITEMPLDMQSYLLRVIEERKLYRLGGNKPQNVNIRIIAATNRDMLSYVDEGKFRLDLYFRLNVIKISIPPLRERKNDIEELTVYYVNRFSEQFGKPIEGIEAEALLLLKNYNWPGNVRELRNVIEYSVNMMEGRKISSKDLPVELSRGQWAQRRGEDYPGGDTLPLNGDYRAYEKQQIHKMMLQYKGNKSRVAKELGMSRNTLTKRLLEMQKDEAGDEALV